MLEWPLIQGHVMGTCAAGVETHGDTKHSSVGPQHGCGLDPATEQAPQMCPLGMILGTRLEGESCYFILQAQDPQRLVGKSLFHLEPKSFSFLSHSKVHGMAGSLPL